MSGSHVDVSYGLNADVSSISGFMLVFVILMLIIGMALSIFMMITMWKFFNKSKKPGYAAVIPVYNVYVLCQIANCPWWYLLLLLIPLANVYFMFVLCNNIAKRYGKTTGFSVGLLLLPIVFFAILAYDKDAVPLEEMGHVEQRDDLLKAMNESKTNNDDVTDDEEILEDTIKDDDLMIEEEPAELEEKTADDDVK